MTEREEDVCWDQLMEWGEDFVYKVAVWELQQDKFHKDTSILVKEEEVCAAMPLTW